ncbi:hypothetical protein [Priestia megaterium]|uniref:hypothetical protein n=1 Tax=Priestia megaterium TaxID=1404 RepID=UPI00317503FF
MPVRLSQRDKEIIEFINRHRAVDRDSLAELFFSALKTPIHGCNSVMVRLYRLGLVERTQQYSPTVYLPADAKIKKNSQKILHFLSILDVYKQMLTYSKPKIVIVEDKPTGKKGGIEPDLFAVWKGAPFWFEIQRNTYSEAKMQAKINLYEDYFHSDEWTSLHWQRPDKPAVFPTIIVVTPVRYIISSDYVKVIQVTDIHELMQKYGGNSKPQQPAPKTSSNNGSIRINLT